MRMRKIFALLFLVMFFKSCFYNKQAILKDDNLHTIQVKNSTISNGSIIMPDKSEDEKI